LLPPSSSSSLQPPLHSSDGLGQQACNPNPNRNPNPNPAPNPAQLGWTWAAGVCHMMKVCFDTNDSWDSMLNNLYGALLSLAANPP
jgi:hypothetical protein